eukprot:403341740
MSSLLDRMADFAAGPIAGGFGLGVRILGPLFVIGFYGLLGLHAYAYFNVVILVLKKRLGVTFGMIWVCIGLILLYNIAYNHFFATFIKPGSPSDLRKIEGLRKEKKRREGRKGLKTVEQDGKVKYIEDDRFEGVSKDVKRLLRYRNKTITNLDQSWHKRCNSCNYIKPLRTHHCSVCNRCVFLMDHHCPWVNNCLGLENYRYFLLFILYLFVGVVYNMITIIAIWNHHIYKQNQSMMSFLVILDFALAIVLVGFNGWNWFLALTGYSTIEFWGSTSRAGVQKYDYNFKSIRDNLYKTFGTYSIIAILSPSLRNIPFSGVEWSYQMRDQGYNEKGEKLVTHNDDELSTRTTQQNTQGNRVSDSTLDSVEEEIKI